jgi:hypothetical protein
MLPSKHLLAAATAAAVQTNVTALSHRVTAAGIMAASTAHAGTAQELMHNSRSSSNRWCVS